MGRFVHKRHQPPSSLDRPRELVVACPPLHSQINLSRIVRAAGCCGVTRVIACGPAKVVRKIARDGADAVELEVHRTLPPVLRKLRAAGYQLVGLEQAVGAMSLHDFQFACKTVLVVGHERLGLTEELLELMDHVVEIPVWGLPCSHNVATAAAMALYEYGRQFPQG